MSVTAIPVAAATTTASFLLPLSTPTNDLWVTGRLVPICHVYDDLARTGSRQLPHGVANRELEILDVLRWAPSMSWRASKTLTELLEVLQTLDRRIGGVGWLVDKSKWMIIYDKKEENQGGATFDSTKVTVDDDVSYAMDFIRVLHECIPRDLRSYLLICRGNPRLRGVDGVWTVSQPLPATTTPSTVPERAV